MDEIAEGKQGGGKLTIWLIIIVASILRFINLGSMSLSNDELSSLTRVRFDSFSEMISKGVYIDVHPFGFQTFLYYWVKIFGESPFALRFPFVIASLISIGLIYQIGRKWFNELTALLSASAFSFLILPILFSQMARMYSLGIMFSLLTVFFWSDFLFLNFYKNRNLSWWGWFISMSIALHLHYFSFLFVSLVGVSGLFFVTRKELVKYIFGGFLSLLFFIPEIPIFMSQMNNGDTGSWMSKPSENYLKDFLFELFNNSYLICLLISFLFVFGILFGVKKEGQNRWRILSIVWFFMSFGIAFFYSIYREPILKFSTMLFTIPFLLLFIFSFVPFTLLKKRNTLITLFLFSFICIYDTVVFGEYYTVNHFGIFREIAEDEQAWIKKYGLKNVPLVINVTNPDYLNYYFNKMEEQPIIVSDRIQFPKDFSKLIKIVDTSSTPYFAYVWSSYTHPLEVPEIIRRKYPILIAKNDYFNAASFLFAKHTGDTHLQTQLFSAICDFDNKLWSNDSKTISTEQFYSGIHSQKMNVEYSVSLKRKLLDIPGSGYRYITFSAMIYLTGKSENIKMIISFDRNNSPYYYYSSNISDFKIKTGEWQPVIVCAEVPKEIMPEDFLLTYFWNPSNKLFYIDDLKVEVHEGVDPYKRFTR